MAIEIYYYRQTLCLPMTVTLSSLETKLYIYKCPYMQCYFSRLHFWNYRKKKSEILSVASCEINRLCPLKEKEETFSFAHHHVRPIEF